MILSRRGARADTAVLLWFGLALLLEALYASNSNSSRTAAAILALQMMVFSIGLWTDWLFVVLIAVWIAIRAIEYFLGIKGAISVRRVVGLACIVLLSNLSLLSAWRVLAGIEQNNNSGFIDELIRTVSRFVYRTGISDDPMTMDLFLIKPISI